MKYKDNFSPDWYSAPGETVLDFLEEKNLSISDFAFQMAENIENSQKLISGRVKINLEIAQKLEKVLGAPAKFWINRESQYREDIARYKSKFSSVEDQAWLDEIPVKDMIRFGWIDKTNFQVNKIGECLNFFSMPNIEAWREYYNPIFQMTAYRTSLSFDSQSGVVAAWLRQGEIEGNKLECKPWSPAKFKLALPKIRSLTTQKDPTKFLPQLVDLCADCGVATVIVRAPSGCRASGATRFISDTKALLLLSFRYLSDDHFWFTFFHEAGHLLLHGKKATFLESSDFLSSNDEQEANEFAATVVIPHEFQSEFLNLRVNGREVVRFARRAGICPGLVVGQLQHLGLIRRNQLNNLKRRFRWKNS